MNIKILVAESSSQVRKNIKRSLKEIGVQQVMEAADASVAINLLRQEQFNAVLADGKIEFGPGKRLMEVIRHIDSNVPILLTTNRSDSPLAFEITHPSASAQLTKPFTTQCLREKLRRLVPAIAS